MSEPIANVAKVMPNGEQERIQLTESFFIVIERGSVVVNGHNELATVLTLAGPAFNNQLGTWGTANRAELDLLVAELKQRIGNVGLH